MIDTFNGALTLNQNLMRGLREAPDVVRRGLTLVLLVGLLVGVVQGISIMISTASPQRVVDEVSAALDQSLRQQTLGANSDEQREVIRILNQNKEPALEVLRSVLELPTPLPRPVGVLFQGLGIMASTPLAYLSGLVLAVAVAHVAARQLGGEGNIQQMLGLGALSVAPHALDALSFIPILGTTLSFIAWAWGLVILIAATSIAHRLDSWRATMAVMLYPLIGALLLFLGFCVLLFFSFAAAGGGA